MGKKRFLLSVDASNLYHSIINDGHIDYQPFIEFGCAQGEIVQSRIYATRTPSGERERGFLLAVKRLGYSHVTARPAHRRADGSSKSDLDTSIIMDALELALSHQIDGVILVSGDSDFLPLVERLVAMGIEVVIVGPDDSTSWELVVAANRFYPASDVLGAHAANTGESEKIIALPIAA
jgi:uncharacterized LabA/DUF88 family protein